jgi:hypothetical protein
VRCAAAGRLATSIARLGQSTLGGHGRRIWELQLAERYEVDGATFGAREEFILVASVKDSSGGPKLVKTVECGMGEFDWNKRLPTRRRPVW